MSSFIKGVALFVAVTCAVWIAVLWRWEATSRDMNTPDILVYLGLLPLTVFAIALLLRWAWRGAAERHAATAATAAALAAQPGAGATPASAPAGDEARRHATVQLLAAHLACAAGETPDELLSAAKEGKPRPSLDAELRHDDGLPVFAARLPGLDLEAIAPWLDTALPALRGQRPEWSTAELPSHVQRALAALQPVLAATAAALEPWASRFAPAPERATAERIERRLRVLLGVPAGWSEFDRAAASALAQATVAERPGAAVPALRCAVTVSAGSGEDLLVQADRLMQTLARDGRDDPVLVAACHSAISDEAIEALERAGQLFSGTTHPRGRMPGEAAAALLLVDADWPADPDADGQAPPVHLHRPALFVRDKPVDAPGRVDATIAVQSLEQALAASRLGADAVAGLVTDADQHSARSAELHGSVLALLPHLDAAEDLRLLGVVTGATDAVGALLAVAGAAAQARASDKPCLALTCGDAVARLALVALPRAPQPTPPPAPAPAA